MKAIAVRAAAVWSQAVDWLTEPLAFINEGNFVLLLPGKGDIEIEIKGLTALFYFKNVTALSGKSVNSPSTSACLYNTS